MKKILTLCLVFFVALVSYGQKNYQLASPNGEIKMNVKVSDKIQYDIFYGEESLLEKGTMRMQVADKCWERIRKWSRVRLAWSMKTSIRWFLSSSPRFAIITTSCC